MKVLITGSSGFIGKALRKKLEDGGHEVVPVRRDLSNFAGADALIHLSGEPIANERWSADKKERILKSRVQSLKELATAIKKLRDGKPAIVISASAVGYYGDRKDEILDENSSPGTGFLADVCRQWEQPILEKSLGPGRQTAMRFGVVLGEGGALSKMAPIFKRGFGGPLGSGKQWMSWIHIQDLIKMIVFILNSDHVSGVVNAVAPHPVTNAQFSKALAEAFGTRSWLKVPATALKVILGERAELLLSSQRVVPRRILDFGFKYKFPEIQSALNDLSSKMDSR